jgi:hypothetical protein
VRRFERFACIDWSGQAVARPKGLALAICGDDDAAPELERPERGWSRQGLLEWLVGHAAAQTNLLVGLDLSPALPFDDHKSYFPGHAEQPRDARALWAMIERHCGDEPHLSASSFPRQTSLSDHFRIQTGRETLTGRHYPPGPGRMRIVEQRQRECAVNPVSCFNLVGAAQVGKSSLTGMRLLHRLAGRVPVWPFDPLPQRGPVIVEIYTSIAAVAAGRPKGRTKMRTWEDCDAALIHPTIASRPTGHSGRVDDHSTDAILTAAWLRRAAHREPLWAPPGLDEVRHTEGWTFGAI